MSAPNKPSKLVKHQLYPIPLETGRSSSSSGQVGSSPEPGGDVAAFKATALYLSPIAFAIHLRIAWDNEVADGAARRDRLREDLRAYVRTLHMRVREHGYCLPCVVVIEPPEAPSDPKRAAELRGEVKSWVSDQEWIRGDFLLFVEEDGDAAQRRLLDVLSPSPPDLRELVPRAARREEEDLEELHKVPNAGPLIEWGLREIRKRDEPQSNQHTGTRRDLQAEEAASALPPLTSIRGLTIDNFRGIRALEADTDADLVLLVGPNGSGKSSFLEAVALAVNGTLAGRPPADLPHRPPSDEDAPRPLRIEITARAQEGPDITYTVEYKPDGAFPYQFKRDEEPVEPSTFFSRQSEQLRSDPERFSFNTRITTWFPEDLSLYFDETSSGKTLKQVLAPAPITVRSLQERFEFRKAVSEDERKRIILTPTPDAEKQRRERLLRSWIEALRERWNAATDLPGLPELPALEGPEVVRTWLEKAGMPLNEPINDPSYLLRHLKRQVDRTMRRIGSEIDELNYGILSREVEKLEQLEVDHRIRAEQAREDLRGLGGQAPGTADLAAVLTSLHLNLDGWREAARRLEPQLGQQLKDELEVVNSQALHNLRSVVSTFVEGRRQMLAEYEATRGQLEKKREEPAKQQLPSEVKARLDGLEAHARWLKTWAEEYIEGQPPEEVWKQMEDIWSEPGELAKRRREAEALDNELEVLGTLLQRCDELMASPNDRVLLQNLEVAANQIFKRFAFQGADNLSLEPLGEEIADGYQARTGSRRLAEWSTGQKAQLGVVMVVAQNVVADLQKGLPHRVLILDDVSTAYDLSNITREALLWRQFAFGEEPYKRQIFLSSHHEELTQHLFDLLVPPQGRSVRVLRFKGWTEESGAEVESFWLEPDTRAASPEGAGALVSHLEEYLNP